MQQQESTNKFFFADNNKTLSIHIQEMHKEKEKAIEDLNLSAMIHASGKLVLIDKLLPKLRAGGHKVLIFSQMIR